MEKAGDGRYRATLDHSWDLMPLPQGGIVASFALRAAEAEVADPAQKLRTCTAVFAGQVAAGELEVDVTVLRRGRSATQVLATVRNAGRDVGDHDARCLRVFKRAAPPSSTCRSPSSRLRRSVIRTAKILLPGWSRSHRARSGPASRAAQLSVTRRGRTTSRPGPRWLLGCASTIPRYGDDGALDPLGVLTLADRMPGSVAERIGRQGDPWFSPSADLTFHLFEPARTEWLLAHDRARWADDGWASAESTHLGRGTETSSPTPLR